MTPIVNLVVMLGILGLMPMGLAMIPWPGVTLAIRLWPWPAVLASVALWLPRGPVATALVVPYALMTLVLVGIAAARAGVLRRAGIPDPAQLALLTALVTPSAASTALVAERAGYPLFGFRLTVLELTVPHLHFAGFAAALVAGLLYQHLSAEQAGGVQAGRRWLLRVAALAVPTGTGMVMAGHFLGDEAELAGAVVLTAGMWAAAWLTWFHLRPSAPDRLTSWLLGISSSVLAITMLLALSWAAGRAFGWAHPSLTWMAATHGVANAVGFATCGLLAWRRLLAQRRLMGQRALSASGDDCALAGDLKRSADV